MKQSSISLFLLATIAALSFSPMAQAASEEWSITEADLSSVCGVRFVVDIDEGQRRAIGESSIRYHYSPLVGLWGPIDHYTKAKIQADLRPENTKESMKCLIALGKWMVPDEKKMGGYGALY